MKGTNKFGLKYIDEYDVELTGHSDLDWAKNPDDRMSTTGYAFNICLGIVSWRGKKQSTVSLSSTKDEYKELCSATFEAI